jgi:hypothetical protein
LGHITSFRLLSGTVFRLRSAKLAPDNSQEWESQPIHRRFESPGAPRKTAERAFGLAQVPRQDEAAERKGCVLCRFACGRKGETFRDRLSAQGVEQPLQAMDNARQSLRVGATVLVPRRVSPIRTVDASSKRFCGVVHSMLRRKGGVNFPGPAHFGFLVLVVASECNIKG